MQVMQKSSSVKQRVKRYMTPSLTINKTVSRRIEANKFNKLMIGVLLFLVLYYVLFMAISMIHKKDKDRYITFRYFESVQLINDDNDVNEGTEYKSDREKELQRRRQRRAQRRARLAEKGERRNIDQDEFSNLSPFGEVYVSDSPYYLLSNLVIMAQLSNAETHLESVLNELQSVSCLFNSTTLVLFESNSIDNTSVILNTFANNSINCDERLYNPHTLSMYENMSSFDELLPLFENEYDDAIYSILNNYTCIDDIDLKEIEFELSSTLQTYSNKTQLQIEDIVYEKVLPIKYLKYRQQILDRATHHSLYTYVISGDQHVEHQLRQELQALKTLRLYDGVNEFHGGHNGWNNQMDMPITDFQKSFGDIHDEIEGLIANDQEIVYEQLRDRRIRFAQKRMQLRKRKQTERVENAEEVLSEEEEALKEQREAEYYYRFRDKLYRIERFVIYRNMLLNRSSSLSKELNIPFDYVMVVDPDVFSMDISTFMNELYYSESNALCMNGLDWRGYTRDSFATVNINGGWLHYGHDPTNDTRYIYNYEHREVKRKRFPSENKRFEAVKSCFGGVVMYKNHENELFDSNCKYTLTRDIFYTKYIDTNVTKYSYDYWVEHRQSKNVYTEETKCELELLREQYVEMLQIEDKRFKNRNSWPRDGDICEHIPFHYCLFDHGWSFAISTRSVIYYNEGYPINRPNDTNWIQYFQNRPSFTK